MHANGNDFLITDDREILNQPIQKLSNRKTGVGFDQLLFFDKEIQSVQIFVPMDQKQRVVSMVCDVLQNYMI